MNILEKKVHLNINTGLLKGDEIISVQKKLGDLKGIFANEDKRASMPQDMLVYSVQAYMPVDEGKEGGLFFGNSTIYPGKVGDEYFMTKGHFHQKRDTAEFYWCVTGEGVLLQMDENRKINAERMTKGSLHYIPGLVAHRVINIGVVPLVFNACWPSDAGHNYAEIEHKGFSGRLLEVNGKPTLIKE